MKNKSAAGGTFRHFWLSFLAAAKKVIWTLTSFRTVDLNGTAGIIRTHSP